ncbi:thrombospondin type 3 repeat-containing protein [Microbulbifer sp. JMSA003]|uniref:thrombospondin type 3 repeat-containing protein n=1 Tax=Microbulbifer sp. JMSA003 TaxID=3243369 RepID=UPI00403A08DD
MQSVASEGEFTVFGPEEFVREHFLPGKDKKGLSWFWKESSWHKKLTKNLGPYKAERTIYVDAPGSMYLLRVQNGPGDIHRVNLATVRLNGKELLNGRDFARGWWLNPRTWGKKGRKNFFEVPVFLSEENELEVQIDGLPGRGLSIQIVGIDSDRPKIAVETTPAENSEGWHNADTTVSFTCSDSISGIESCSKPVAIRSETAGQQVTGIAVDRAKNSSSVTKTVKLDKTPPLVMVSANPQAGESGWNSTPVSLSFLCSDPLSGVKDCPADKLVETEGSSQGFSVVAVDIAGNTAEFTHNVNIDLSAPEITLQESPASNNAGWHKQDVTVAFICDDTVSGVAGCSENVVVSGEGSELEIFGEARDLAGNSRSITAHLKIDKTLPSIFSQVSPLANEAGWHNTNPRVSFSCIDTLSGIANCTDAQTFSLEAEKHKVVGTASDLAGNSNNTTVLLNIDKTAPLLEVEYSHSANDSGWYSSPVTLTYKCEDSLSGIGFCPEPQTLSGEGLDLRVSPEAVDIAGNTNRKELVLKIDQTAPELVFLSPTAGASLTERRPQLKLSVQDNLQLDFESIAIFTGSTLLQVDCQFSDDTIECSPLTDLPSGEITLSAQIADMAENNSSTEITIRIDSDGDGVADDIDKCPNTPENEPVDSEGCADSQKDSDSDGVLNSSDQCPNTPDDEPVNNEGCSVSQLDTDGDGVGNAEDQCPNTAPGVSVEADGCDISQRDTDNDGVLDINDAFPEDPNETSDLDGDGIGDNADTDRDGDGVENDLDLFPENPLESSDLDNDGIGDNSDTDRDGDTVENDSDAFPDDPTRSKLPVVMINTPSTLTTVGHTPIDVSGVVDSDAVAFTLNGLAVPFEGGQFNAQVTLHEGHNTVVARMVDAAGVVSTASISIALDLTPPYITVDSHEDGQLVHSDTVTITGLVNDIVRGTIEEDEATVTVNGVTASIVNRSYQALDIPLAEGENTLTVEAIDQVGNSAEYSFSLTYEPLSGQRLEIYSGNNQSATINSELAESLAVQVLDDSGNPVADKNVVFRVTQGSGVVGIGGDLEGRGVLEKTDAQGIARTRYRLGQRAGVGNQKVRARVVGYQDEAIFSASAEGNLGNKLSVNSGNNQRGGTHQPLPAPFVVVATDEGANVVPGARIRFEIVNGGGHFQNDSQIYETQTDGDGRASAHLTMGGVDGLDQQRVKATLLDAPVIDGVKQNITAGFTASAFIPGDAGTTSISGIVMDNQDTPLPGVTVRVDGTTREAMTDSEGQFKITEVPAGPVHLIADGSTTTVEGEYPALAYNLVTVSGVDNPLSAPIYMVKLDTENAVWAGKEDVELTLPEVPGFKLEIPAGSVTFPDGSREGYISATVVNSSKVPMVPPNGMQPQFIVTIQPTNAMFDPPARLTLPNVDGHTPGAQVEMFSFDHDLEEFVAIGLGTVSEDGTTIKSNPGVGVVKAGWHCGAQPGGSGTPNNCDYCHECDGQNCNLVPDRPAEVQIDGNCKLETCGGSEPDLNDKPEDDPRDCVDPTCTDTADPDDSEIPLEAEVNDCAVCRGGKAVNAKGEHIPKQNQDEHDCKEIYCDDTEEFKNEDLPGENQIVGDCAVAQCDGTNRYDPGDKGEDTNLEDCSQYKCFPAPRGGERKVVRATDQFPEEEIVDACNKRIFSCGGTVFSPQVESEIKKHTGEPLTDVLACNTCIDGVLEGKDGKLKATISKKIGIASDLDGRIQRFLSALGEVNGDTSAEVKVDVYTCCKEETEGETWEGSANFSMGVSSRLQVYPAPGVKLPDFDGVVDTVWGKYGASLETELGVFFVGKAAAEGNAKQKYSDCEEGCLEFGVGIKGEFGLEGGGAIELCIAAGVEYCSSGSAWVYGKAGLSGGFDADCSGGTKGKACFDGVTGGVKGGLKISWDDGKKYYQEEFDISLGPYFNKCI